MAAAARACSPLTIHVLNTEGGIPASKMSVSLHRLDTDLMIWNMQSVGTTNEHGHCSGLISQDDFTSGIYKLRYETGSYWENLDLTSFYPYVEVVFTVTDQDQGIHLPLQMSRCSYSTYRGS